MSSPSLDAAGKSLVWKFYCVRRIPQAVFAERGGSPGEGRDARSFWFGFSRIPLRVGAGPSMGLLAPSLRAGFAILARGPLRRGILENPKQKLPTNGVPPPGSPRARKRFARSAFNRDRRLAIGRRGDRLRLAARDGRRGDRFEIARSGRSPRRPKSQPEHDDSQNGGSDEALPPDPTPANCSRSDTVAVPPARARRSTPKNTADHPREHRVLARLQSVEKRARGDASDEGEGQGGEDHVADHGRVDRVGLRRELEELVVEARDRPAALGPENPDRKCEADQQRREQSDEQPEPHEQPVPSARETRRAPRSGS